MHHRLFQFTVRRTPVEFAHEGKTLNGPVDIARFLFAYAEGLDREHFFVFALDVKLRVIGFETVAIGGLEDVSVHPREVFRGALISGAHSIICAHNHPSGDPSPSSSDVGLAEDLTRAGRVLDIPVHDFIILGDASAYSLADKGPINL